MYELVGHSRAAVYFIALITVGLGGAVGWWLKSLIGPTGEPKNAVELGRRWAGWIVFAASVSLLSKFFGKLDAVSFSLWLAGGGAWAMVAYVLGWAYGKFFKFRSASPSPSTAAPNTSSQPPQSVHLEADDKFDENAVYATIAEELRTGNTDQGLWIRLFAECDGDENKTKVSYIKRRAATLLAEEQPSLDNLTCEHEVEASRALSAKLLDQEPRSTAIKDGSAKKAKELVLRINTFSRLSVKEKIEVLELLGGAFQWTGGALGSKCVVAFDSVAHEFPRAQEFEKWFETTILPIARERLKVLFNN